MAHIMHQADHPDHRRRINRTFGILIVQTDVAADHRRTQHPAGFRHTVYRGLQLPENVRLLRITEVQVIRNRQRLRAGAHNVAGRFAHRDPAPDFRVQVNELAVAVRCHRERLAGAANRHHSGIRSRLNRRFRADHVIVLVINPFFAGHRRGSQNLFQSVIQIRHFRITKRINLRSLLIISSTLDGLL